MYNSVNHIDDSSRIDLISFDLRSEGREVAFTGCFDNEEKQYEINSFISNKSNFTYEENNCYRYLRAHKSVNKLVAKVEEILTYKIIIDNLNSMPVYNVILQDNLPAGTTYKINSLRLNGYIQSGAYPQLGVLIPQIKGDSGVIVTFEVSVNLARPVPKVVENFSTIIINERESINTNTVTTEITSLHYDEELKGDLRKDDVVEKEGINLLKYCKKSLLEEKEENYLNLKITKIADKECVEFNDIITYRINVRNDETLSLFNIQLFDYRDDALEFIKGSLTFNNQIVDISILDEIMNIGDIQPSEECIIEYKMRVKSTTRDGWLRSDVYAKYSYYTKQEELIKGISKISKTKIKVRAMAFKVYNFNKVVELEEGSVTGIIIEETYIEVVIDDKYILEGESLKDNEGDILSGYQLKIFGHIDVLVQYSVLYSEVEVRVKTWSIPFSSQLILSPNYEEGDNIELHYNIEYSVADVLSLKDINLGANILFYI